MKAKLFRSKRSRLLAMILAAVVAVSCLVIGLGTTFAAKDSVIGDFTQQPNTYPTVEVGQTHGRDTIGGRKINTSDPQIATATMVDSVVTTTGVKAGVVAVMPSSSNGNVARWMYQITDSSLISGYSIKNAAEVQFSGPGTSVPSPVTATPAGAFGTIKWKSLQPGIAEASNGTPQDLADGFGPKGTITGLKKGVAIIIGEFTDKWGVEHDLHILVGVGVSLGGGGDIDHPDLGDLMEWIAKGEGILSIPPADNPYTGDSLDALRDAADDGKGVVDMPAPTENDIRDAINKIKDAIDHLEKKDEPHEDVIGPDKDGNYYLPLNKPKNVYQVVNKDGTSKDHPPKYIYNPRNPAEYPEDNRPAYPGSGPATGGAFWVEDPKGSNIWKKVKDDGALQDSPAIWGGPGGAFGDGDDKVVEMFGGDYWYHLEQNIWQKVDKNNPLRLEPTLVGGGGDENPAYTPATPIYRHTDGKYYLGPLGPAGEQYYYGDKKAGGNGKVMSVPGAQHPTDGKYWLVDGEMVTSQPLKAVSVKVIPDVTLVDCGATKQFAVEITMGDGSKVTDTGAATWEIYPAGIGTIGANGLLTIHPATPSGATCMVITRSKVTPDVWGYALIGVSQATPTVKSVTVSPATANVARGTSQTFTATVTMSDNTLNTAGVNWSVDSTQSTINVNGVLSVHASEAKNSLLVTAISKADGSVKGTATVNVTTAPVYVTSVVIAPANPSVQQGKTQSFTATVYKSNSTTSTQGVAWSVQNGVSGTSISSGGVLTVSGNEPVNKQLKVIATSNEDNTVKGEATVYVTAMGVKGVVVTPSGQTVEKGQQRQFSALVTMDDNSTNSDVIWSVDSTSGSTISSTGLLKVSTTETKSTLTVTATSTRDTSAKGSVTVTIAAMGVKSVQVTPTSATVEKGMTFSFSAKAYMNDDSLVNNPNVAWSVNGSNSSIGSSGVLTVGKNETAATLTVTATYGGKQGTATVTVKALGIKSISISPANPTVERGKTQAFTATITFNDNTTATGPVTWSLYGNTGGTSISSNGLLTVGSNQGAGNNVLWVYATAQADPSKSASTPINVKLPSVPAGGKLEILDKNGKVISENQWFVLTTSMSTYQFGARFYHPDGRVITSASSPASFSWYTNANNPNTGKDEAKFVGNTNYGLLSIWTKTADSRYITCYYIGEKFGNSYTYTVIPFVIN